MFAVQVRFPGEAWSYLTVEDDDYYGRAVKVPCMSEDADDAMTFLAEQGYTIVSKQNGIVVSKGGRQGEARLVSL